MSKSVAIASDMIVSELVCIDAVHEFMAESFGANVLLKNVTSKKPIRDSEEMNRAVDFFGNGFFKL